MSSMKKTIKLNKKQFHAFCDVITKQDMCMEYCDKKYCPFARIDVSCFKITAVKIEVEYEKG